MAKTTIKGNEIVLTKETHQKYKEEYENLIKIERPAVQQALKEARAQGDLSENAEYDAARDRQSVVEGRIAELENILQNCVVIDKKDISNDTAGIGSKVKYLDLKENKEYEIIIMGSHDANPFENKISNESPLAKAVYDAKPGQVVEVETAEKYNIKIIDIKH
ncbi:MAG: transcription elongation factor GreA [Metamycoplasmataceae bacterium]|uniref:transcription elongation factor GreA n=1 Tax=Mycoplasmopsis lipophila TaxID=2117 RepID=UPI0038732D3C